MYRATTPTITINLDESTENFVEFRMAFSQNEETVFVLERKQLIVDSKSLAHKLTQEEANKFEGGVPVYVQVRAKSESGDVVATDKFAFVFDEVLDDEVM